MMGRCSLTRVAVPPGLGSQSPVTGSGEEHDTQYNEEHKETQESGREEGAG